MNEINASIIVPTRNRVDRLKKCIDSLINQTYDKGYEIIVVDDGSKDIYVQKYKNLIENSEFAEIKYLRQHARGPGIARNLGVEFSRGKILLFIDDDCVAPENWLNNIMQAFRENCNLSMVGGPVVLQFNESSPWKKMNAYFNQTAKISRSYYYSSYKFTPFNTLITANLAVKKEDFLQLGGFKKEYSYLGDDTSLFYQFLREKKKIHFDKSIRVSHIYTEKLLKILIHKCYKYGRVNALIYHDFFKNYVTFDIKLLHLWRNCLPHVNFKNRLLTIYINLDYLKLLLLLIVFSIFYQLIIYFILLASVISAIIICVSKKHYLFYVFFFKVFANLFLLFGRAWYSIKYKIICI